MVGKSNVGKSSLINALVGIRRLARTSNTPGRTRLINWFEVEDEPRIFLVDLPGYGYAKVSKQEKKAWLPLIESYLAERESLCGVILLLDARREPSADDIDLAEWFQERNIPWRLVMTKMDKLPKNKRKPIGQKIANALGLAKKPILSSAETRDGLDEVWSLIERMTQG